MKTFKLLTVKIMYFVFGIKLQVKWSFNPFAKPPIQYLSQIVIEDQNNSP